MQGFKNYIDEIRRKARFKILPFRQTKIPGARISLLTPSRVGLSFLSQKFQMKKRNHQFIEGMLASLAGIHLRADR
jgi:hypothetical protein